MIKLDNIAPVSAERQEEARAALELLDGMRDGSAVTRPTDIPQAKIVWKTPTDAWQAGFRDGFYGIECRHVPCFHSEYERGQISGMVERRNRGAIGQKAPLDEPDGK